MSFMLVIRDGWVRERNEMGVWEVFNDGVGFVLGVRLICV